MNWQYKTEVKRGNLGEEIVDNLLHSKGYVIYKPITEAAHAFDRLAIKDKEKACIAKVKTKPRRFAYPDTGIDVRHYMEYKRVWRKHRIPVFIFFVDDNEGTVRCLNLSEFFEVNEPKKYIHKGKTLSYPMDYKRIKYFYQPEMKIVYELSAEEREQIKELYSGSYPEHYLI